MNKREAGVTLIELMVALAIFSLVAVPLIMSFTNAMKTAGNSVEITKSELLAQMAVEEIASRSADELESLASASLMQPYAPATPSGSPAVTPTPTPYGVQLTYKVSKASSYIMDNGYFGEAQPPTPVSTPVPYMMTFNVDDDGVDIFDEGGVLLKENLSKDKEYFIKIESLALNSFRAKVYQREPITATPQPLPTIVPTPTPTPVLVVAEPSGDFTCTSENIRIKILNENITENIFFAVDIDDVNNSPNENKAVEIHIVDDLARKIQLKNEGVDYFEQIKFINNDHYKDHATTVYKIEVVLKRFERGSVDAISTKNFVAYVNK